MRLHRGQTPGRREVVPLLERARREGRALCAVEDLTSAPFEPLDVLANEGHTRAVMKIQEGCDNRCAYCIIPEVRGPIRSRSLADVAAEARALGRAGYREVVLTGIHLASYGRDFRDGTTLLDAIEAVCRARGRAHAAGVARARLDRRPYAQRHGAQRKALPQFHLSLQSGCDGCSAPCARRYTTAQFRPRGAEPAGELPRLRRHHGRHHRIPRGNRGGVPGDDGLLPRDRLCAPARLPLLRAAGHAAADFPGAVPYPSGRRGRGGSSPWERRRRAPMCAASWAARSRS